MKNSKHLAIVAAAAVTLLTASCSDNNTNAVHNENDTNLLDTRRNTDTTSNYLSRDSTDANQTPTREGIGLKEADN